MARVLIVDDDPDLLRSVARVLEKEGHEVREANDGKSALEMVAEAPPDLIVSDIYMPEMDGIELLARVHADHPNVPMVAMSGGSYMAKEALLRDVSMLGAVGVLEKPFTVERLVSVVNEALGKDVVDEAD